jgi:predicted AlkP superfamily phosphohydrolase/phosphomutase
MVYLNSTARRAGAPIETLRQLDDARAAAAAALASARHPETGRALFPKIVPIAETYGLDPAREGYPDLIALPDESYWVRTKLTPGTAWVEADPNLPGTHRPEGIVALAGTGIAPGRTLQAELPDVAPTVLALLGLPVPAHMEGTPLPCIPAPSIARRDLAAPAVAGPHQPQFDYTPEEQAIIEQRLADLGYLE